MTDQSVSTRSPGLEKQKLKSAHHPGAPAVLKKIAQGVATESLHRIIEQSLPPECSQEERLDELVRRFLLLRETPGREARNSRLSVSGLAGALAKIAAEAGIPPERFYGALLERIVGEEEADGSAAAQPKVPTKQKILEAALEVFSFKGFHTSTMDEIAERAGVGKGTLYRYFETKEKLFDELVRLRLGELQKKAACLLDGPEDVLTLIARYIRTYFEFFDNNRMLYRLIVQEGLELGEHSPDMYFKRIMRALPNLKRKVYEASQHGTLKDDVDFQTVFYGAMGFVHGVIQKWLVRDCSYSLIEELPGVLEVLFYGFVKHQEPKEIRY